MSIVCSIDDTVASKWSMRATRRAEDHVTVPTITATDSISPTATVGILTWRMSVVSVNQEFHIAARMITDFAAHIMKTAGPK